MHQLRAVIDAEGLEPVARLSVHRETLIAYSLMKFFQKDWHGVRDAASELEAIEAQLKVFRGKA